MKATGVIQITDDLQLKNPVLDLLKSTYCHDTNMIEVEMTFSEGVYKHSRTFSYPAGNDGESLVASVMNFLNNDPILKVFT